MSELTFSVRELQAHIGEALRAVERGDHVIVTSRGRPVAELARARKKSFSKEDAVERKLRRLAAQGRVLLGTPGPIEDFPTIQETGLLDRWMADRDERERIF